MVRGPSNDPDTEDLYSSNSVRPDLGDSFDDASQSFQARCASLAKKCNFKGQREKLRTPVRRWTFDIIDLRVWIGLLGIPFLFLPLDTAIRDSPGICKDEWGLVKAHLLHR